MFKWELKKKCQHKHERYQFIIKARISQNKRFIKFDKYEIQS